MNNGRLSDPVKRHHKRESCGPVNIQQIEGNKNRKDAVSVCMPRTYCPPFGIIVAHLILILVSLGMLANMVHILSERTAGTTSPMTYFFILAFVVIIILSGSMLFHMLFVKRTIIPPPCI